MRLLGWPGVLTDVRPELRATCVLVMGSQADLPPPSSLTQRESM